jgi:quercetin dioxygenase-like cupin family protein
MFQAFTGLRAFPVIFTIVKMRMSRVLGLVFLATATLAQQQQSVEITSEPSHHLVFENEYVRVFNVTVAPKATTLVHRHNHDYLFVTLGDTDVVNARVGEKPVPLHLNDGEVRFTPGNFAHAAINESDHPFHNITIELLKPATNVKVCTTSCDLGPPCAGVCPTVERKITSDQWTVSFVTLPPGARVDKHTHAMAHMAVAVSNLDLTVQEGTSNSEVKRAPGGLDWVPAGTTHTVVNRATSTARMVTLDFRTESK